MTSEIQTSEVVCTTSVKPFITVDIGAVVF